MVVQSDVVIKVEKRIIMWLDVDIKLDIRMVVWGVDIKVD